MQLQSAANAQALHSYVSTQGLNSSAALHSAASPVNSQTLHSSAAVSFQDRVTFSSAALALSQQAGQQTAQSTTVVALQTSDEAELVGLESTGAKPDSGGRPVGAGGQQDSEHQELQELQETRELAQRDREVRAHEQAHAAIGGQYASAPSYTYERGPDGRLYAVAGEVKIDTSPVPNNPQATLEKAEMIQRAALSVAEPSSADRAAAAQARAMAIEARAEILQQEKAREDSAREASSEPSAEIERGPSAGEKLQELRDQCQARTEGATEVMLEFNDRMKEISVQLAEINKKLVDAGVFQKLYPEGSILDQMV